MCEIEAHSLRSCLGYEQFLLDFQTLVSLAAEGKSTNCSCSHMTDSLQQSLDNFRRLCPSIQWPSTVVCLRDNSLANQLSRESCSEATDRVTATVRTFENYSRDTLEDGTRVPVNLPSNVFRAVVRVNRAKRLPTECPLPTAGQMCTIVKEEIITDDSSSCILPEDDPMTKVTPDSEESNGKIQDDLASPLDVHAEPAGILNSIIKVEPPDPEMLHDSQAQQDEGDAMGEKQDDYEITSSEGSHQNASVCPANLNVGQIYVFKTEPPDVPDSTCEAFTGRTDNDDSREDHQYTADKELRALPFSTTSSITDNDGSQEDHERTSTKGHTAERVSSDANPEDDDNKDYQENSNKSCVKSNESANEDEPLSAVSSPSLSLSPMLTEAEEITDTDENGLYTTTSSSLPPPSPRPMEAEQSIDELNALRTASCPSLPPCPSATEAKQNNGEDAHRTASSSPSPSARAIEAKRSTDQDSLSTISSPPVSPESMQAEYQEANSISTSPDTAGMEEKTNTTKCTESDPPKTPSKRKTGDSHAASSSKKSKKGREHDAVITSKSPFRTTNSSTRSDSGNKKETGKRYKGSNNCQKKQQSSERSNCKALHKSKHENSRPCHHSKEAKRISERERSPHRRETSRSHSKGETSSTRRKSHYYKEERKRHRSGNTREQAKARHNLREENSRSRREVREGRRVIRSLFDTLDLPEFQRDQQEASSDHRSYTDFLMSRNRSRSPRGYDEVPQHDHWDNHPSSAAGGFDRDEYGNVEIVHRRRETELETRISAPSVLARQHMYRDSVSYPSTSSGIWDPPQSDHQDYGAPTFISPAYPVLILPYEVMVPSPVWMPDDFGDSFAVDLPY